MRGAAPSRRLPEGMTRRTERDWSPSARAALERLRALCRALEGSEEGLSFGNPTFRAGGKAYLVLDRYRDQECLWLRVERAERADLLALAGWFDSPYDPRRKALCCALEHVDWRRVPRLVRASHALALADTAARAPRKRSR